MTLISLDEVNRILEQMISDANTSMYPKGKYIEMKEFNILSSERASIEIAEDRINSIPTHDPIAILSEIIEEWKLKWDGEENYSPIYILEEALSRITKQ